MSLYVFVSKSDEYPSCGIAARSIEEAIARIKTYWYPDFFDSDFSVTIVNNTSGVELIYPKDKP